MGAKTGLLAYADGEVPELLRRVGAADRERTAAMMRRLYPGGVVEARPGSNLCDGVYPPPGTTYAASWPGIDVLCDQRVIIDYPSRLPEPLVAAGADRRMVLHAMHSVVDWLAFAVWEDGRLVRSLSLSPDAGVIEDLGEPLPFERPFWAGDRPADVIPWPDEENEPYPLPFHPLDLGEEALRGLFGFIQEGQSAPDDIAAEHITLHGFAVHAPAGPDSQDRDRPRRGQSGKNNNATRQSRQEFFDAMDTGELDFSEIVESTGPRNADGSLKRDGGP